MLPWSHVPSFLHTINCKTHRNIFLCLLPPISHLTVSSALSNQIFTPLPSPSTETSPQGDGWPPPFPMERYNCTLHITDLSSAYDPVVSSFFCHTFQLISSLNSCYHTLLNFLHFSNYFFRVSLFGFSYCCLITGVS